MFLTIIAFVLILSVLVLIHEFGHFIVAKKLGIKVEEFGFGFPPKVVGYKHGETTYSINLLPFGGFVKLYGEDDAGMGKLSIKTPGELKDVKRAFFARPAWQRAIIVLAGVIMNFLLAVVIISYLFAVQGVAVPGKNIRLVEVIKNSPAASAGLLVGDRIIAVDGEKITDTSKFIKETRQNVGKSVVLTVSREGKTFSVQLTPRTKYPKNEGPMGIAISNVEIKKYTWYEAPVRGTYEALKFSYMIVKGLSDMVVNFALHGTKPTGVAGPVGVAQLTGQAVNLGINATLWFMALLSLNLAVLNVLPIPALDGGRLFFILIELITRKKVHPKYESYAHAVGLAILLGFLVLVTIADILRLISGKSILSP